MVLCCLFSGEALPDDPRKHNAKQFQVNMMQAPGADPGCCIASCLCPCCAQMVIRKKALRGDLTRYTCCQGYFDHYGPCVRSGRCGEQSCPAFCLCLEAWCCNSCAVSATRMMVMDERNLQPDPWDNRIIRCNNCLQLASCICDILAIFMSELRDGASILRTIADCAYAMVQGCMTAQINVELKPQNEVYFAPNMQEQTMSRV